MSAHRDPLRERDLRLVGIHAAVLTLVDVGVVLLRMSADDFDALVDLAARARRADLQITPLDAAAAQEQHPS